MKKTFLLALLAGFCIGLGGTVYLSVGGAIGAMLFAVGLYTIVVFGLNLFTGKVGYALDNKPSYIGTLAIIWLGNLAGTGLMALIIRFTSDYAYMSSKLNREHWGIVTAKLNDDLLSIFLLAIGCGVCMFIAVDGYKKTEGISKAVFVIFPVMVFILCGFEHCIANMFYFWLAGSFTLKTLVYLIVMTLGNSVGGLLIPAVTKLAGDKK